jgi:hypothetical protein
MNDLELLTDSGEKHHNEHGHIDGAGYSDSRYVNSNTAGRGYGDGFAYGDGLGDGPSIMNGGDEDGNGTGLGRENQALTGNGVGYGTICDYTLPHRIGLPTGNGWSSE